MILEPNSAGAQALANQGQSAIRRTDPTPEPATENLVTSWQKKIITARDSELLKRDFARMKLMTAFLREGCDRSEWGADQYVANVLLRYVSQKVSSLYAKNPRVSAKRRPRLEHRIWDGNPDSLALALQTVQTTIADPLNPGPYLEAVDLIRDVAEAHQRKQLMDKVGKTLEILFHYFLDEQEPNFKTCAKQLVRRTIITGVGYTDLMFLREMEGRPEAHQALHDSSTLLAKIEQIVSDLQDREIDEQHSSVAELRSMVANMAGDATTVTREGLVFDFPRSWEIIPAPECKQLNGFVGAPWVTREFKMRPDQVKQNFEIDLGSGNYQSLKPVNKAITPQAAAQGEPEQDLATVWRVQDKETRTEFWLCEGYKDWLRPPRTPDITLDRFYTTFSLTFNDVEPDDEKVSINPPGDVELLLHAAKEYNRSRDGLRTHRQANKPQYAMAKGAIEENDKSALASGIAHAVLELSALQPGAKIDDLLQQIKKHPIDPAMYDTTPVFEDILRTGGQQEANLGNSQNDVTATQSSIAEGSRLSSVGSNVDDLDGHLSELSKAGGEGMLQHMSEATVKEIAGPGAVWPTLSRREIARQVYLEIKAGSSGRPNKAQDLANMERATPLLVQIPGINPVWLARKLLETLDDTNLDLDEALVSGLPSILALNAMAGRPPTGPAADNEGTPAGGAQPSTGDPSSDPAQQQQAGAQNSPEPPRNEPGPQPAFPTGVGF